MTDPELEEVLRRYRPAGPPPELRARIVVSATAGGRTWPWTAAAASLLAAVCVMQASTDNVYERMKDEFTPSQVSVLDDLPALQSAVQEDPLLQERVEALARQEQSDSRRRPFDAEPSWQ